MATTNAAVYTLTTTAATLPIQFSQVHPLTGFVLASQTHIITMLPDRSAAVIQVMSAGVIVTSDTVALSPDTVIQVCVDFLPRVSGSALAMYAIGTDQVAVVMQTSAPERGTLVVNFLDDGCEVIGVGIKFQCLPVVGTAVRFVSRGDEREAMPFLETLNEVFGAKKTIEWPVKTLPIL
jgi:hypothetical protein